MYYAVAKRRHSFLLKLAGFRRPLPQCAWQGGTFSHCFLTRLTSTPFYSVRLKSMSHTAILPCGLPWGRSGSLLAWSWSSWRVWLCMFAFLFARFLFFIFYFFRSCSVRACRSGDPCFQVDWAAARKVPMRLMQQSLWRLKHLEIIAFGIAVTRWKPDSTDPTPTFSCFKCLALPGYCLASENQGFVQCAGCSRLDPLARNRFVLSWLLLFTPKWFGKTTFRKRLMTRWTGSWKGDHLKLSWSFCETH